MAFSSTTITMGTPTSQATAGTTVTVLRSTMPALELSTDGADLLYVYLIGVNAALATGDGAPVTDLAIIFDASAPIIDSPYADRSPWGIAVWVAAGTSLVKARGSNTRSNS